MALCTRQPPQHHLGLSSPPCPLASPSPVWGVYILFLLPRTLSSTTTPASLGNLDNKVISLGVRNARISLVLASVDSWSPYRCIALAWDTSHSKKPSLIISTPRPSSVLAEWSNSFLLSPFMSLLTLPHTLFMTISAICRSCFCACWTSCRVRQPSSLCRITTVLPNFSPCFHPPPLVHILSTKAE